MKFNRISCRTAVWGDAVFASFAELMGTLEKPCVHGIAGNIKKKRSQCHPPLTTEKPYSQNTTPLFKIIRQGTQKHRREAQGIGA